MSEQRELKQVCAVCRGRGDFTPPVSNHRRPCSACGGSGNIGNKWRAEYKNYPDKQKAIPQDLGGGTISCERCKKSEVVNSKTVADYLSWGWPQCCGQTMTWFPNKVPA